MKQNKFLIRVIASHLIFSFSYSQLLWAADVRQMLLDAKAFFEEEDARRPHGMTSADLQASQEAQQAMIDQQQALQDFQNTTFNLTTPNGDVLKYVGDKLSAVTRPDGTALNNILTDANGNIVDADLKLADGSVQIYQSGQVIGYQTPDGSQVIYQNGVILKVTDKSGVDTFYKFTKDDQGNVTETILDSPTHTTKYDANQKIKEAARKSDNQRIFYTNGIIQEIVNADGSQIFFTSDIVNGDTVVTPQGSSPDVYIDPQGNKFYFTGGTVSKVVLPDNATLESITWDANNKVDSATLTETDGSKYIYQLKQLTRSYDVANVVTNYTYTATNITAAKAGNTWVYLADKTPVSFTDLVGNITTYVQSGTYKGFKNTETVGGITYTYTYQGSGATLVVQKTAPGVSTVLSNTTLGTASRSTGWSTNTTEQSLTNNSPGWVTYNAVVPAAGSLKIQFDSTSTGTTPSGYAFNLDIYVDGVLKYDNFQALASKNTWRSSSLTLTGLSQGTRAIKIQWTNDYYVKSQYDSNFKFKNLKLTHTSSPTTQTVTSGYQSTPITTRVDTVKNLTFVKPAAPGSINSTDFTSITYDSLANLKQVVFKDNSKLIFDQGILKQSFDALGNQTDFNFEQSGISNIVGSSIAQSNLTSTYSAEGKLSSIQVSGMTVHYLPDSTLDWIEKPDGTEIYGMVFDAAGNLTNATIYTPDGEERTYAAGKLVNLLRPDQSRLLYANDKPIQLITPEKLTYNFTYTPTAVEAVLLQGTVTPDALTPVKMEYDLSFNLKKVTRQNQEILNYPNTDLLSIDTPNEAPKVFNYQKDAAEKVLSYTVTQGNVVTNYDANGQPVSALISPDAANPNTLNITYQYGKMREIKKNGVVTFNYSYSFDAAGTEITEVQDLEENTKKRYVGANLVTSLDNATSVLSSYNYEPFVIASPEGAKQSMRVRQVEVSRLGRVLHTYAYAYNAQGVTVTDEGGVVRTYDASNKLLFLERDGSKFAYSYDMVTSQVPGPDVETVLPVTLYDTTARSVKSWDGLPAWMTGTNGGAPVLYTSWGGQYVDYSVSLSSAGHLRVEFDATNRDSDGPPPDYPGFQIEMFVDGISQGVTIVPALKNQWQPASILLQNLASGSHSVRLKWLNDASGANGTDANFEFKALKLTQISAGSVVSTSKEITTETLLERRLSDGSLAKYSGGKISEIGLSDGRVLKNFVQAGDGSISETRLFSNAQDAVGVLVVFQNGRISKITDASGQELLFTYDLDASGNILATWVQKGSVRFKYDGAGSVAGLKLAGVLDPNESAQAATHSYQSGSNGPSSFDGNFTTSQSASASQSFDRTQGSVSVSIYSTHVFTQPQSITQLRYRLAASGSGWGDYSNNNHASGYADIEYQLADGVWRPVAGTVSGMGDTGQMTKTTALDGVTAVRAFANGYGEGSDHGGATAGAWIYEIQYTLADLANLSFVKNTNVSGQTTGYTVTGYRGTLVFDAAGSVTQTDPDYAAVQADLAGTIQKLAALPYKNTDFDTLRLAFADTGEVVAQEFSAEGTLETQTKLDGTTTLFDNGRPTAVMSETGEKLIEYFYDASGNPTRVYLKNARDKLPDEIANASQRIEESRAATLKNLAVQKNLAYQSIASQAQTAVDSLTAQLSQLQGQFNQVAGTSAKGKAAKSARGDVLNQIGGQMDQVGAAIQQVRANEADAYTGLDAQVKTLSDQIEADSQTAFAALADQEVQLKREILRQEVSPVVYDYYRRILGRDPSTAEYDSWINQIDYNSGFTPFGASAAFDGSYDYLSTADSADFNFSGGAWTVDGWIKVDDVSVRRSVFSQGDTIGNYVWLLVEPGGDLVFTVSVGYSWQVILGSGANGIKADQWHHIAISENGDTYKLFIDGVQVASRASTIRPLDYPGQFRIGTNVWSGDFLKGRVEDIRVTNGVSRFNAGFAPAAEPAVVDATTKFLLKSSSTSLTGVVDSASTTRAFTLTGNVFVDPIDSKFPASKASVTEVRTASGQTLTTALSAHIQSLPELAERQTYVSTIKQNVRTLVQDYLAMTDAQKAAYAVALGLTAQDLIVLSSSDVTKILAWLDSRSLHFGQSAFLALESLLDQKGITYTRTDLAQKAILIDILTGVISPLDDGDLVISVFSLNKVAQGYGLALNGANLSWDDLRSIYQANPTARIIAHINGNHFIIITGIQADRITYIDPGIGKDKQNESFTVTKEGFLKAWKGNVTLEQAKLQAVANYQSKTLTAAQAKNIRGAFWGSLLGFLGFVFNIIIPGSGIFFQIASLVASIAEGDWISGLSAVVTLGLGDIGNALGNIFKGAFQGMVNSLGPLGQIVQGVGKFFTNVYQGVVGFVNSAISFLPGIGPAIQGAAAAQGVNLGAQVVNWALSTGLTVGVSKGLESLGVNPQIAGYLGSLAAGAVIGGLSPQTKNLSDKAVSRADMIRTSIQEANTIASIGNFGMQMGLDPIFSRILGNSLAVIQGLVIQNPVTALDQSFTWVKNGLTTSLTQYSLEKLGNSLGLSPLISSAIAAPIAANLAGAMSATKWTGQVPVSANDGFDVNPTKIIDKRSGTDIFIPGPGTAERTWWDSVFGFLKNNAYLMAASAASAYYLTKPTIVGSGQTPPPATTTEMPIPAGATAVTYQDYFTGQSKTGYQINSSPTNYIVYDKATGNPVKRVSNGVVEEGKFAGIVVLEADGSISVDYKVSPDYISKGQIKYTTETGGQARFKIQDGGVQEIYIDATSPDVVLNLGTTKDASNKVLNGIVKILTLGLELSVSNGTVSKSTGGQQGSEEVTKKLKRIFVFGNGFENERRAEDTPDPLIESYVLDLEGRSIIDPVRKLMFYLYEMTDMVFNGVDWLTDFEPAAAYALMHLLEGPVGSIFETIDLLLSVLSTPLLPESIRGAVQAIKDYLATDWGIGNNLVQEVIKELDQKGPIEDGIAFVHSGATAPLLEALRVKPYDIQTVIVYEGPHPNYNENILNPYLERVIHVRGTGGVAEGDSFVPFLDWASFDNTANSKFENINIQILGAFHNDFSYNPNDYANRTGWAQKQIDRERINRQTNLFMRRLYELALADQTSSNNINNFLESLKIDGSALKENGVWVIDPFKLGLLP